MMAGLFSFFETPAVGLHEVEVLQGQLRHELSPHTRRSQTALVCVSVFLETGIY